MRDEKREKRAAEIEEAAYMVLEEKGYGGLSMISVARAAKASNETLYRWYGDKLGLFEALIARNAGIVEATLESDEGLSPAEELMRVGPVLLHMLLGPRAIALNRAAAADSSGKLGGALGRIGRETVGPRIAGVMKRALDAGMLGGGDPREITEVWFGLLIGDAQIRRVTGAMDLPDGSDFPNRAAVSIERLRRVFPGNA